MVTLDPDVAMNLKEDKNGILNSKQIISHLIKDEIEAGISSSRIVIGGFSQGAAMALYTALSNEHDLGGVIALSGFLPLRNSFPKAATCINQDIPTLLVYGEADNVVPYLSIALPTYKIMKTFMSNLEFKVYKNLTHTIIPDEIEYVKQFLMRVLSFKYE